MDSNVSLEPHDHKNPNIRSADDVLVIEASPFAETLSYDPVTIRYSFMSASRKKAGEAWSVEQQRSTNTYGGVGVSGSYDYGPHHSKCTDEDVFNLFQKFAEKCRSEGLTEVPRQKSSYTYGLTAQQAFKLSPPEA